MLKRVNVVWGNIETASAVDLYQLPWRHIRDTHLVFAWCRQLLLDALLGATYALFGFDAEHGGMQIDDVAIKDVEADFFVGGSCGDLAGRSRNWNARA